MPSRPSRLAARPLAELASLLPEAEWDGATAGIEVRGVTVDSHDVRPGDLYAALPGSRTHGAAYVADVAAAGAVGVLTDPDGRGRAQAARLPVVVVDDPRGVLGEVARWAYRDPSADLLLLGVTGTNGKTTTAYLVEAGLRAAGHQVGLVGTIDVHVGDAVLPSARTTPEASALQGLLAVMRERGASAAALEVSSHALALHRIDGTTFDAAIFTNLSQDHLDFHRDMDDYFAAKASLFTPERTRRAVIDIDDPWGRRLAARTAATAVPITTVSARGAPAAHWRATDIDGGVRGSSFRALGPGGAEATVSVRLPGLFNVANALAALAALVTAGVPLPAAAAGIGGMTGVPGRMERIEAGQPFAALVDYAHTPEALTTLLRTLRPLTPGRLLVVLGCGGDRDRMKRPLMGAAAATEADLAVLTSDNPRSEDPAAILTSLRSGVDTSDPDRRGDVVVEPDRRAAIRLAVANARPTDTVVVAGRGHETEQERAGVHTPFDDRVVLGEAIADQLPAPRAPRDPT